jgi:hypothetical protein
MDPSQWVQLGKCQPFTTLFLCYSFLCGRNLFATLTVSPSRSFLSEGLQIFRQEVEAIKSVPGIRTNFICYPMQRNAIAAMKERGGNALGIDHERDEPLFSMCFSALCYEY